MRRITAFGARHALDGDDRVDAALEHVGRGAVRMVLVGRDGTLGDLVVRDPEQASAVAELAGLVLAEASAREWAGRIRTGPRQWKRTAGAQLGGTRAGGTDR